MNAQRPHGRLQVARAFGIPVYVHFSWVIVFALISWTLATGYFPAASPDLPALSAWARGIVASLLFFVSIFLHEMGHALVAVRNGIPIRSITLFVFGGVSEMQRDPDDGRTELRIAIAGPVVSLALAAVFWLLAAVAPAGAATRSVARYLALINLILAVFNLVPAFPLDGGRLVRGLLWPRVGKARATRLAAGAGSFLAFLLMGLGVLELLAGRGIDGVWYVLLGWFLQEAAAGASRGAQLDEALLGVQVRDAMVTDVATIPAHLSLADAAHQHFLHTGYGGYPVVRGDAVVGLLCLRDVLRHPADERDSVSVQAAMAPITDALVAAPDEPLRSAFSRMAERGVGRLLVMDGGRLVGMLPMSAIVRQLRVRQQLGS